MFEDPIIKAFVTMGGSLAVIIVLFIYIKKYAGRFGKSANGIDLKVVAKIALPPKGFLYVVEAENKKILIGVTDKSITKIADLTEENIISDRQKNVQQAFENVDIDNIIPQMSQFKSSLSFGSFVKSIFHKN